MVDNRADPLNALIRSKDKGTDQGIGNRTDSTSENPVAPVRRIFRAGSQSQRLRLPVVCGDEIARHSHGDKRVQAPASFFVDGQANHR